MNIRDYRNVMEQLSPTPELEGRIREGLAHPPRRKARPRRLAGKVLAAAIAIACTFMVAMAVSPQLRAAVLTLFHLEETEQVPGPDRDRPDQPELTQDTIDQQVDVQYIHLPVSGSGLDYGTGVVYQPKQAADGTLLAVSFWAVEGDALVPLETRTTDFSMDWQGGTYSDTVFWCEYNGTVACCRSGSTGTSSGALCLVSGIPGRTDAVFFSLSQNTEAGYSVSTSRLLDLTTGQVTDLLAGSQWEQASSPVYLDWNPTFSAAVLTPDWKEWVYWDRTGKATTSLTELTGLNILCAYFSPDGTLILLARSDTDPPLCDVWTYEPRSGTLTRTFSHLPCYGWESETHGFLFFAGSGLGIYADEVGQVTVLDLITGMQTPVEGFTFLPGDSLFTPNPSDTKILFAGRADTGYEGLGISSLGVMDLESGAFQLLDRDNFDALTDLELDWFDEDRVAITAHETHNFHQTYLYLYRF